MNHQFIPAISAASTNDMHSLKATIGGQSGFIVVGLERLPAIRLAENLYATSHPTPQAISRSMWADQADLHELKSLADMGHFIARYKSFKANA